MSTNGPGPPTSARGPPTSRSATTLDVTELPSYPSLDLSFIQIRRALTRLRRKLSMSTTNHDYILAHSSPNFTIRVLHVLCSACLHSLSYLSNGRRFLAGCASSLLASSLILFSIVACGSPSGTDAAAAATSSCPGSA